MRARLNGGATLLNRSVASPMRVLIVAIVTYQRPEHSAGVPAARVFMKPPKTTPSQRWKGCPCLRREITDACDCFDVACLLLGFLGLVLGAAALGRGLRRLGAAAAQPRPPPPQSLAERAGVECAATALTAAASLVAAAAAGRLHAGGDCGGRCDVLHAMMRLSNDQAGVCRGP